MSMSRRSKPDRLNETATLPAYHLEFGFGNLPNQVHRNAVKRGFEFTVMVAGESGLGKSTLINSLFLTELYKDRDVPSCEASLARTTEIQKQTVDIEERGVKLRLNVVDTPGLGDAICNNDCYRLIVRYIDEQYERYLNDESGLNRRQLRDTRVHCLFYFVSPHQRGLKPLDLLVLRAVHTRVNVLVLIAKADTLTRKEQVALKDTLRKQFVAHGISLYKVPECANDEDAAFKAQCVAIQAAMPFAVVGSSCVRTVAPGTQPARTRGRTYDFGFVEIENPNHCDFPILRTLLIIHMQNMLDVTHEVIYENYRVAKLSRMASKNSTLEKVEPTKHASVSSASTVSRTSLADNNEAEKQLVEKDSELRRMRELLAKQPQEDTSTSNVLSTPSVNTANTSVSVPAVANPVSIESPNCTPRSEAIACSTPNNSDKIMPPVCITNKELSPPVENSPKSDSVVAVKTNGAAASPQPSPSPAAATTTVTVRGSNAYSSLNLSRTQPPETTNAAESPTVVKKTVETESPGGGTPVQKSRLSFFSISKKAPPVLPRSANTTSRTTEKPPASSSFVL